MLKLLGAVLVLFSCTALGWGKSMSLQRRLEQLREIEKLVHLILGEITYRKEALPEALLRTSQKAVPPLMNFCKKFLGRQVCFRENASLRFSGKQHSVVWKTAP